MAGPGSFLRGGQGTAWTGSVGTTPGRGSQDPGGPRRSQGRDRQGRAGPAHAKQGVPRSPAHRAQAWALTSVPEVLTQQARNCEEPTPRPELQAGGTGPAVPRRLPWGRMSTSGMGVDSPLLWTGSFSYPFRREGGRPAPLTCSQSGHLQIPAPAEQLDGRTQAARGPSTGPAPLGHQAHRNQSNLW